MKIKGLFLFSVFIFSVVFLPYLSIINHASSTSFTFLTINRYQLFISPYNMTNISLLLQNATKSIYAELYELTYQPLINILANKANQGVSVYIVLSAYAYGGIPSDEESAVQYLESHGAHVKFLSNFYYIHSKVFVINNSTVIISTNNPTYYGFHYDKGVAIAIFNSTIATWFATIILNDYNEYFPYYNYPGLVISPINSFSQLYGLFSYNSSTIYAAFEEIYSDSDLTNVLLSHEHSIIITSRNDVNLQTIYDLTAKVAVIDNYVYIGSINLSHNSLFDNRELGIIIKNNMLAEEMKNVIERWSNYMIKNQTISSTTKTNTTAPHNITTITPAETTNTMTDISEHGISSIIDILKQSVMMATKNTYIVLAILMILILTFYIIVEKKK